MNLPEEMEEMNKSGVEAGLRFANIYMASAEQLLRLQLDAAKAALDENAKNAKALLNVKDPQQVMALRTKLAESSMEKAMDFSRNVYEVTSRAQQEIAQLLESRVAEFKKSVAGSVDKAAKGAPAGADVALSALKSTFAASSTALDNMTRAARQLAELAQSNVRAAANIASDAVKGGGKPGKK